MTIERETLAAYADGELSEAARAEVEKVLAENPAMAASLASEQELRRRLRETYDPVAEEALPERLTQTILKGRATAGANAHGLRRGLWTAVAASVLIGVGFGAGFYSRTATVGVVTADLQPTPRLARALQGVPAGASGDLRMVVSFNDVEGRYCRVFQAPSLSGLACRNSGNWRIEALAASNNEEAEYRLASSLPTGITAAMDLIIAGEPLDASAEAAALEAGWDRH